MQMSLPEAFLVLVFRCARHGRQPNLTAFCTRMGASATQLAAALEALTDLGLLRADARGEHLTLEGLAVAATLARSHPARQRTEARPRLAA